MAEDKKDRTVHSVRAAVKNFESIVDSQANNPDYRPPRLPPPPRGRSDLIGVTNGSPDRSNLIGQSCGDVINEDDDDSTQPMSLAERMEALRKSMRGKNELRRSVDPIANRPIGSIKDHMRQSVDSFEKSVHQPDPSVRTVGDVRNILRRKENEGDENDKKQVNRNSSVFEAASDSRFNNEFSDETVSRKLPPRPTPRKSKRKKESSYDDGASGTLERSQSCDDLSSSCEPILSPRSYHSQKGLDVLTSAGQCDDKLIGEFETKIGSPSLIRRESEIHTERVQAQTTRKRSEICCDDDGFRARGVLSPINDNSNKPKTLITDESLATGISHVNDNLDDSFCSTPGSPGSVDDTISGRHVKEFSLSASRNLDRLSKDSGIGMRSGSVENLSSRSRSTTKNKSSSRSRSAVGEKSDNQLADWIEDFNQDLLSPCLIKEEQEFNFCVKHCNDPDITSLKLLVERKSALDYLLPLFKTHKESSSEETGFTDSIVSEDGDVNLLRTNLMKKAEVKLAVLIREKSSLSARLSELDEFKSKLDALMKSYAGMRQYTKYRQIAEDLDKLLHLLNMLSDRLARMYNSIWHGDASMPAAHNLATMNSKYEDQMCRFSEAVQLKENIDSRSQQMAQCAKNCLSTSDWSLYKQFFFDKYQLFIDQVSLDYRINQSQAQINALKDLLCSESDF